MRPALYVLVIALTAPLAGCELLGMGGAPASGGTQAGPSMTAQTTIIALQTWLMVEQQKATAAGKTARAATAGSLIGNLTSLRTEPNCANRLRLATTVSTGLQGEFPNYQAELGLGTNLVNILAAGYPGCQ